MDYTPATLPECLRLEDRVTFSAGGTKFKLVVCGDYVDVTAGRLLHSSGGCRELMTMLGLTSDDDSWRDFLSAAYNYPAGGGLWRVYKQYDHRAATAAIRAIIDRLVEPPAQTVQPGDKALGPIITDKRESGAVVRFRDINASVLNAPMTIALQPDGGVVLKYGRSNTQRIGCFKQDTHTGRIYLTLSPIQKDSLRIERDPSEGVIFSVLETEE